MGTFFWRLQFSTLCDFDDLGGLVPCTFGNVFNLLNDIVTFKHFAKDDMLTVEPTEMDRQYRSQEVQPNRSQLTW